MPDGPGFEYLPGEGGQVSHRVGLQARAPFPPTTVYAGSSNHTLTPVSTATNTPGKAITVGSYPLAIAITR